MNKKKKIKKKTDINLYRFVFRNNENGVNIEFKLNKFILLKTILLIKKKFNIIFSDIK